MIQDLHVILKFQYFAWNRSDNSVETMKAHLELLKEKGAVWWGRTQAIAPERAETLKQQIASGIKTHVFLYATGVPKSVSEDGNLWFHANLKRVHAGTPNDRELIPPYYRHMDLAFAFLLENIKPIAFEKGRTPKVPGQASIRYAGLVGGIAPENLMTPGTEKPICNLEHPETPQMEQSNLEIEYQKVIERHPLKEPESLQEKVTSLLSIVNDLHQENSILNKYKAMYDKILNAEYLFNSEKFLEMWLEENIHKVGDNLVIIDRQPYAAWSDGKFGKLDLLAMNKETKELVIIEVKTRKRDKNSGYSQYLRYTTWAKKNLIALAKKYASHGLRPTEALSFMIITDFVDEEMTEICKGHNITLLRIFGGLGFDKVS